MNSLGELTTAQKQRLKDVEKHRPTPYQAPNYQTTNYHTIKPRYPPTFPPLQTAYQHQSLSQPTSPEFQFPTQLPQNQLPFQQQQPNTYQGLYQPSPFTQIPTNFQHTPSQFQPQPLPQTQPWGTQGFGRGRGRGRPVDKTNSTCHTCGRYRFID